MANYNYSFFGLCPPSDILNKVSTKCRGTVSALIFRYKCGKVQLISGFILSTTLYCIFSYYLLQTRLDLSLNFPPENGSKFKFRNVTFSLLH